MCSVCLDRPLTGDATFGGLSRERNKRDKRKMPDVLYCGDKMTSTTEALCTQLDNVHHELHKLQVENKKL